MLLVYQTVKKPLSLRVINLRQVQTMAIYKVSHLEGINRLISNCIVASDITITTYHYFTHEIRLL